MRISDWSSDVCSSYLIGTQVVAGEVAGDLAQPGQEAGRVLQALEVLPGGEEGILGDVLAGRDVAGDRQRHRGDRVLAGTHDAPVGVAVAARGGWQPGADQQVDGFGVPGWSAERRVGKECVIELR